MSLTQPFGDPRMAHDAGVMFARNLAAQEAQRWHEYVERGTREALSAWRAVRLQMREARARAA